MINTNIYNFLRIVNTRSCTGQTAIEFPRGKDGRPSVSTKSDNCTNVLVQARFHPTFIPVMFSKPVYLFPLASRQTCRPRRSVERPDDHIDFVIYGFNKPPFCIDRKEVVVALV